MPDTLNKTILRQAGEIRALKMLVAALIAEMATGHEDPQQFIISLAAPLHQDIESAPGLENALMADAQGDVADWVETAAIATLRLGNLI